MKTPSAYWISQHCGDGRFGILYFTLVSTVTGEYSFALVSMVTGGYSFALVSTVTGGYSFALVSTVTVSIPFHNYWHEVVASILYLTESCEMMFPVCTVTNNKKDQLGWRI